MPSQNIHKLVDHWLEKLLHVEDLGMRRTLLMERLEALSPRNLAESLQHILAGARGGRPGCLAALEVLQDLDPLLQKNGRMYFSDTYTYATHQGYELVTDFLRRPKPAPHPDALLSPAPEAIPGRDLTLGERRAQAMSVDRNTIERLLQDSDPRVAAKLLQNPRMTLSLVIRMASRRPAPEAVLVTIARSPRWGTQYEVKEALVRNPYTPPDLAMKLMPSLRISELRQIAEDSKLHPEVRDSAQTLIAARALGGKIPPSGSGA